MMKKLLMMAIVALSMANNAMAADETTVSIIGADGETAQTAALTTIEKVEFAADSVCFILAGDEGTDTIKYARSGVDQILFKVSTATAIKSAKAQADKVTIAAHGSQFTVSGIKAGTPVAVFDVNGRLAAQTKATGESVSLDATGLKSGIYLVRAGNKAIKIVKK